MMVFLKKSFWALVVFSSLLTAASPEEYHLLVSAGALTDFEPYQPFFHSRIFFSDASLSVVKNANVVAYATQDTLFYADNLKKEDIIDAGGAIESGSVKSGFIGSSYRGVVLSGTLSDELKRHLGAESAKFSFERRLAHGKEIFAFSRDNKKTVHWAKTVDELKRVPAVLVHDKKSNAVSVVFARLVGDVGHRLGLIDSLLKRPGSNTDYLELGNNHGAVRALGADYVKALQKRKPSAVMLGTFEMASLMGQTQVLESLPIIYPFGDNFHKKSNHAFVKKQPIHFWSATGSENLWPLYSKLGKRVLVQDILENMKTQFAAPEQSLNVVRVFSEEAAKEAARSVYVDLVLLHAKEPFEKLPTREIVELKEASSDGFDQVSPIVKISYLDVTEIYLRGTTKGNVSTVEVRRHAITDAGPVADDAIKSQEPTLEAGLPELSSVSSELSAWETKTLENTLGKIMLTESKANVAIVESLKNVTPIEGSVPLELSVSLLNPSGNLATIRTSGKQLKKIAQAINSGTLTRRYSIFGMDSRAKLIGDRAINDNEKFTIALSESALLELFGFARLGGLNDDYSIRAPFVEAIYGDMKGLYFIGGPKIVPMSDTANSIQDALNTLRAADRFDDVLIRALRIMDTVTIKNALDYPEGMPQHVVTFDIGFFDLGLSKNVVNSTYEEYQSKFPMSRGNVDKFAHLFLFTKMSLNYETPKLFTSLTADVKFMQTSVERKPEKDKTKLGIKLRLPWEKTIMKGNSVVLSPILKSIYETKFVPNSLWSNPMEKDKITGEPQPLPPRTRRIDTLLGVNLDFTKLGFNADLGGVLAADFNRVNTTDALDYGPGVNFFSRWGLFGPLELSSEITSCYLFPLPQNRARDKVALAVEGTVWLRVARIYDFSVAAISDFLIASLQEQPSKISMSSIFGITISYGRLFRLFG